MGEQHDISQNQFRDQNIINQGRIRDIHYHLPHPPARPEFAHEITGPLPGPHFLVPFSKNKRFVGREDILQRLEDDLFDDDGPHAAAIVGLGGVGKTQVALQIAYHARTQPGWSVFWLSALSMAAFEQACKEMVDRIKIPTPATEDAKQTVKRYLESTASGQWLVVVDNADDVATIMAPGGIYTSLPTKSKGCLLFTTRTRDVALAVADEDPEELEEMSEDEAKAFLEKLLPTSQANDEMATELLRTLTFLPLAISQAAAYMKRNKTSVARYLSLLRDVREEAIGLLSREFPDRTRYTESRHAVASTWLVSFEQIRANDGPAAELLSFLSQIEPRAIPLSMLPPTGTKESIEHAVGTLCGYAFLHRREEEGMLDMHSLVHLAAQEWVRGKGVADGVKSNFILHMATVFQSDDWENREVWRSYMPHALKAIQVSKEGERWEAGKCQLGYWAGRCLYVEGRIAEAVNLLEHVIKLEEMMLAENHPHRLASQHELARAYQTNGQVEEALKLLEHVVKIQETTLAENHQHRLASQHELAGAYRANGRVKEAVELLEHVVKVKETTLAKNHPSRLASQRALAGVYQANGQVREALKLLQHIDEIQETTLAENHPDRLASQHALARVYQSNGQVKEALKLFQHVIKVEETMLAENHPDRLASQHELAGAYQANGQVEEALKLLQHVVKVEETTLAENHPSRLASQHELAIVYQANGQVKEAVKLLQHVVELQETTMIENHPERLASQHELAGAYQANGQVEEALKLLQHVAKVEEMTLAENHPSRLASQHELAGAYRANGQVKKAVQLLQHVVKMEETTLEENHPNRLASQHELARAYRANGQVKEAVELLEHVVKVQEMTLAESHPDQLASQHELARVYRANGQAKEAMKLLEHVVSVKSQVMAPSHPSRQVSEQLLSKWVVSKS